MTGILEYWKNGIMDEWKNPIRYWSSALPKSSFFNGAW
jgi:hypothetical protein